MTTAELFDAVVGSPAAGEPAHTETLEVALGPTEDTALAAVASALGISEDVVGLGAWALLLARLVGTEGAAVGWAPEGGELRALQIPVLVAGPAATWLRGLIALAAEGPTGTAPQSAWAAAARDDVLAGDDP